MGESTTDRPALVQAILDRRLDSAEVPMHFVALDGSTEHVTLGVLIDDALALAGGLRAHGLGCGDVVAIRGGNTLAYSRAVIAGILAGVVTLPLVSLLGDADVETVLTLSETRLLLSERRGPKRSLEDHLTTIAHRHEPPVALIGPGTPIAGCVDLPSDGPEWSAEEFPSGDRAPAFLLFTSGTTGVPKGVQHSYASLMAEVEDFSRDLDLRWTGHVFSPFPLGHVAGLDSLLVSVCLGRELTMLSAWDARVAADALEAHGATGTGSTPFYAATLFDEFDRRGTTATSLRTMQSGGGVVGAALVRRAGTYGIAMVRAYGSTEHPSATSTRSEDPLEIRAETDGRPTCGSQVRIVDDEGRAVPDGTVGEVTLRGPEQFLGYLGGDGGPDERGWFATGDLGRMSDGLLTITGRAKDIIIRAGENISTIEVEQLLATFPGVLEAAVVGRPDPRYGERVHAYVVRRPGAPPVDLDGLRGHFDRLGVARHKIPEGVDEVAELPRNSLGKVQKHLLGLSPH